MPKPKHSVWRYFECIFKNKNKNSYGKWAKCRECSKEMQGIPSRMEKHILTHQKNMHSDTVSRETTHSVPEDVLPSTSKRSVNTSESYMPQATKKQHVLTMAKDADVIATSDMYSKELNLQIGRYFYATNTPFVHADHTEFKKMLNSLRPGYNGPSSHQIGGPILNEVYDDILKECRNTLQEETV
ncbi:unnamed protein product [Psylliodes chrysocephalus]|uniref:BED-type domain-containing protein n=1 Tax=Psylliodes chrysocephalus TaxID=3402493 RepID=A0A9P0D7L0_9CUCU|nr:unnamed protein product [Psylliodes chrysocephala]